MRELKLMVNKKEIVIAVTFFVLGVILMYFYGQQRISENRNLTDRFMANCGAAMSSAHQLVQNCNRTTDEVVACFSDPKCEVRELDQRIGTINEDSKRINDELLEYGRELEEIKKTYEKK